MITYCLFGFTFLGLYEIVRLYIFGKTTITNALYYGAALILSLGAIEAIYRYFNEAEKLSRLKMQNEETLHLLDIQQGYYQRISAQLHIARRVSHDF